SEAPGKLIDWVAPATFTGTITGEGYQQAELYWTLSVDGQTIEQQHATLSGSNAFAIPVAVDQIAARIPGFSGSDRLHAIDLTVFATVLTVEGELSTACGRATLNGGRLAWVETEGRKKKKIWDIF
ncbi:MAG: hypothetical protein ABI743_01440, partial [bacterium]